LSQERHRILAVGVLIVRQQAEVQVGPPARRTDGNGTYGRDPALAMPRLLDGRLALRGVGAADDRLELEARLIEEGEMGLPPLSLLDDSGQVLTPSVGDLLGAPLLGLLLRPLAAPVQPLADDLADMLDMVLDAEVAADDHSDSVGRPEVIVPAVGLGPWSRSRSNCRI
jgi:hypothetical protein